MGNAIESTKRTCRNIFKFSTVSLSVQDKQDIIVHEEGVINQEDDEYQRYLEQERVRRAELEKEHEEALAKLKVATDKQFESDKMQARELVHGRVTKELEDLTITIRQLSEDLQKPVDEEMEHQLEHWRAPYTKLDDYVLETMYALLHWLGSQHEYRVLTMAQLLFFLKSPYIRARRKYVMRTERILRETGLSLFDLKLTCNPIKLAEYFDVVRKRVALTKVNDDADTEHISMKENRATWHALI